MQRESIQQACVQYVKQQIVAGVGIYRDYIKTFRVGATNDGIVQRITHAKVHPNIDIQSVTFNGGKDALGLSDVIQHDTYAIASADIRAEQQKILNNLQPFHEEIAAHIKGSPAFAFKASGSELMMRNQPSHACISIENCSSCHGSCKNTCDNCAGVGSNACRSCRGHGQVQETYEVTERRPCVSCGGVGGSQQMVPRPGYQPEMRWVKCLHCVGGINVFFHQVERWVRCTSCSGAGKITCDPCSGSGQVACGNCGGKGKHTTLQKLVATYAIEKDVHYQAYGADNQPVKFTLHNHIKREPDDLCHQHLEDDAHLQVTRAQELATFALTKVTVHRPDEPTVDIKLIGGGTQAPGVTHCPPGMCDKTLSHLINIDGLQNFRDRLNSVESVKSLPDIGGGGTDLKLFSAEFRRAILHQGYLLTDRLHNMAKRRRTVRGLLTAALFAALLYLALSEFPAQHFPDFTRTQLIILFSALLYVVVFIAILKIKQWLAARQRWRNKTDRQRRMIRQRWRFYQALIYFVALPALLLQGTPLDGLNDPGFGPALTAQTADFWVQAIAVLGAMLAAIVTAIIVPRYTSKIAIHIPPENHARATATDKARSVTDLMAKIANVLMVLLALIAFLPDTLLTVIGLSGLASPVISWVFITLLAGVVAFGLHASRARRQLLATLSRYRLMS